MPALTRLAREHDLKASRNAPRRPPEEVPELSSGTADTGTRLIQGDNLDAPKAFCRPMGGQR